MSGEMMGKINEFLKARGSKELQMPACWMNAICPKSCMDKHCPCYTKKGPDVKNE